MNLRTIDIIVISVIAALIAAGLITSTLPSNKAVDNSGKKAGDNLPREQKKSGNSSEGHALAPASEPVLIDAFGSPVGDVIAHQQVLVQSEITNTQDRKQPFVYIVQVRNSEGITVLLSWMKSELFVNDKLKVTQSWTPEVPGKYKIEVFVWDSIDGKTVLSPTRKISVEVQT